MRLKVEAAEFRDWREQRGWTQEHAGTVLRVSEITVRFWEAGRREIPAPVHLLRQYIDRFGLID